MKITQHSMPPTTPPASKKGIEKSLWLLRNSTIGKPTNKTERNETIYVTTKVEPRSVSELELGVCHIDRTTHNKTGASGATKSPATDFMTYLILL